MVVRAELRHDLGADALVLHLLEQLHPDPRVADLGELRDRFRLLRLHDGADEDFLGQGVRVERRLREDAYHVERRRPRDLDGIDDLVPDSLDDRGHRHHGGDPDHHAQDRERRAELVGAQLVEGDEPALGYGMELHSYLNAATGSRRAARMAGYTPNITPTLAPRPSATTTIPMATTAGITVNRMRVRFFQKLTSASAVSTVKSFVWPGRRRCAMRIASSARCMPCCTSVASGIFTEITVVLRRP